MINKEVNRNSTTSPYPGPSNSGRTTSIGRGVDIPQIPTKPIVRPDLQASQDLRATPILDSAQMNDRYSGLPKMPPQDLTSHLPAHQCTRLSPHPPLSLGEDILTTIHPRTKPWLGFSQLVAGSKRLTLRLLQRLPSLISLLTLWMTM